MNVVQTRSIARRRQRVTRTHDKDAFELQGGLNLVEPPTTIAPGYCLAAENYEIGIDGGYERIGGFERFDGRASPSSQTYYVLPFRHFLPLTNLTVGGLIEGFNWGSATIHRIFELTPYGFQKAILTEHAHYWGASDTVITEDFSGVLPIPPVIPVPFRGIGVSSHTGCDSKQFAPKRAFLMTENTANQPHYTNPSILGTDDLDIGDFCRMSMFLKFPETNGRRYIKLEMNQAAFSGVKLSAVFDMQNALVVSQVAGAAMLEDYGNGWYRASISSTEAATAALSAGSVGINIMLMSSPTVETYPGDGVSGILMTGLHGDKRAGQQVPMTYYAPNWLSGDPIASGTGYLVIRALTESFAFPGPPGITTYENTLLDTLAVQIGYSSGIENQHAAPTLSEHLQYRQEVADAQRALILKVPGDGPIRGVWLYNGVCHAFRDNATACRMYKSTGSGWSEVVFAQHLNFDGGLPAGASLVVEGATVVGGTSGASAQIKRVNLINPNWAGSAAVGTLVLGTITGGPYQNDESLTISATPVALADGANYVPTWDDGGLFRFRTYNFYGAASKRRMYGVNGLNKAFEYDSTDGVLAAIRTGMTVDTPTHVGVHLYHLFLGFPGGSVQNSGVGRPADWTVITGTLELAVGDHITELIEEVDDTLFVFTRDQSYRLTGYTKDSFALQRFDPRNGAIANSVQRIGMAIHLDDRGFSNLISSDRFGNYESNSVSRLIHPLVKKLLEDTTVTASVIYRSGNRYRCFFSDGRFISIGIDGQKVTGHMVCDYSKIVRCACSEEDLAGIERLFFGSDDGYVYEAEKGTSFDGAMIRAGLRPAYHHSGYPDREKRYRKGRIEAILDGQATVFVTPDLSFGETFRPEMDITATIGGAIWDNTMVWEGFSWDQRIEPLKEFTIKADGTNIGLAIRHESAIEFPHTLRAIVYQSALRGMNRRTAVG